MKAYLSSENIKKGHVEIAVTGSKSESNRLLVLQALYPTIAIENLSESDDSVVLAKALPRTNGIVDIHHAGTAMRFLTAYFAGQSGVEITLTGSARMQERPIGILVDALRDLGAHIEYLANDGYPPIRIKGTVLKEDAVKLAANISSQYISALMLLAPSLEHGLTIYLEGKVTSVPYIEMTLALLKRIGIRGLYANNTIHIAPAKSIKEHKVRVESDWSSASYFYSIVALSTDTTIQLSSYRKDSLQGDAALSKLYSAMGVQTSFDEEQQRIVLTKSVEKLKTHLTLDLSNTPDIAQTIAVTCFGLRMGCELTGLHTLKIKETDRLLALEKELSKLGAVVSVTNDSLVLEAAEKLKENVAIDTYHDHRMAMAFAPLGLLTDIVINDCGVVSKSFPSFWEDMASVGIGVQLKR